ncbi:MAG: glutamate-cysteine ligase family protein [Micrococcaceae bacterium]|nr:glutamate-cysteine ligase family protein [Micrococcaceae bacterium]
MKFGIEEDLLCVDPATGRRVETGDPGTGSEADEAEPDSFIFRTGAEALEALLEDRRALGALAADGGAIATGFGLVPALSPAADPCAPSTGREGGALRIHLPVPTPEEGVQVMNHLRRWMPVLMALGANSPLWNTADTGYASWRTLRNRTLPVHGIPPHFFGARDYTERVDRLLESPGIDTQDHVGWGARLSPLRGSLEVRAIDMQLTAGESVLFALLVRSLAVEALHRSPTPDGITPEESDAATWHAARHGVEGDLVGLPSCERSSPSALAHLMFDTVEDHLIGFGDAAYVSAGLRELLNSGNGAARQRVAFEHGGIARVVEFAGAELLRETTW